jgi:hypothetical protein
MFNSFLGNTVTKDKMGSWLQALAGLALAGGATRAAWRLLTKNPKPLRSDPNIVKLPIKVQDVEEKEAGLRETASTVLNTPMGLGLPAAALAFGVPAYGTYSIVDKIMDNKYKRELEKKRDALKQKFEAILESKSAQLERIWEKFVALSEEEPVKQAWVGETTGLASGAVLTAMLALMYLGHKAGYNWAEEHSPEDIRDKAIREFVANRPVRPPTLVPTALSKNIKVPKPLAVNDDDEL